MTAHVATPWTAAWVSAVPDETEERLVRLAKKGDPDAFSELVRRHQHTVFNLACRFMRDPTLAEDMVQEAFLKAFRLLRTFRGDCAFGTWMYRVTCSVCLTEINRRKKRGEVALRPRHDRAAGGSRLESADIPDLVRRCVTMLPGRYAAIITLYYLREIPYEEIARIMRIPMGTLKIWMHRARKQLKRIVEKEILSNGPNEPAWCGRHH
jgi:RNA polymerase sigma-70 factor (ECF subfamily)